MADFCKQCSIANFGADYGDLALSPDDPKRGTLEPGCGWLNLCEGCGVTVTDDDGACIADASYDCLEKHGVQRDRKPE